MIFQKIFTIGVFVRKILIKTEHGAFVREAVTTCNREGFDFINQDTSYEKAPAISAAP